MTICNALASLTLFMAIASILVLLLTEVQRRHADSVYKRGFAAWDAGIAMMKYAAACQGIAHDVWCAAQAGEHEMIPEILKRELPPKPEEPKQ